MTNTNNQTSWRTRCEQAIKDFFTENAYKGMADDPEHLFELLMLGHGVRCRVNGIRLTCALAAYATLRYLEEHPELVEPKERTVTA